MIALQRFVLEKKCNGSAVTNAAVSRDICSSFIGILLYSYYATAPIHKQTKKHLKSFDFL